MNDIIKELGISSGPWNIQGMFDDHIEGSDGIRVACLENNIYNNGRVIKEAPSMLQWMIVDLYIQDIMDFHTDYSKGYINKIERMFGVTVSNHVKTMYITQKNIIENATGKKWEDVKNKLEKVING